MSALRTVLARPAAIAQATAEEREDLDVVAGGRHVGIGGDDEHRHLPTRPRSARLRPGAAGRASACSHVERDPVVEVCTKERPPANGRDGGPGPVVEGPPHVALRLSGDSVAK